MKNIKIFVMLFCSLTMTLCFTAPPASAAVNEALCINEDLIMSVVKTLTAQVIVMYDLSEYEFGVDVPDFLAFATDGAQVTNISHVSNKNSMGISYQYDRWEDKIHDYLEILKNMGFAMYDSNNGDSFWEKGSMGVAVTRTWETTVTVTVFYGDGPGPGDVL